MASPPEAPAITAVRVKALLLDARLDSEIHRNKTHSVNYKMHNNKTY